MKTVIKLPLKQVKKLHVTEGQIIEKGNSIASYSDDAPDVEINLSQILKVKTKDIHKFLKKKPGENILVHELLSTRKTLLTQVNVKSPISGKISHVDLMRGTVVISPIMSDHHKFYAPVSGNIKKVGSDYLEMEIDGHKIPAISGEGNEVSGELINAHQAYPSLMEIASEVEDKIILIKQANGEIAAKLDTLGALGVISEKKPAKSGLPYLTVSKEDFRELEKKTGANIWIRPSMHELIICRQ